MKKTNFVIVAHARSGSHMIDSLLNSHPCIISNGEKFNGINQADCDLLFRKYAANPDESDTILGFKLAYQLRNNKKNDIWKKVTNNNHFKVLFWYRANLLRAYVSREIASKTNKWMGRGEQPELSDKRIMIEMDQCIKWINKTSFQHAISRYEFRHHLSISVSYENFLFDKNKAAEILNFLGVDSTIQLSTDLKRQNPEPLDQLIVNYDEFVASFQKTKWAAFLDQ
jgi:LPS sulfotransferase NodH